MVQAGALSRGATDAEGNLLFQGQSHCDAGRWSEGLGALREALQTLHDNPVALRVYAHYLAICPEEGLGDPAGALPLAERAVAIFRRESAEIHDSGARPAPSSLATALDTLAECLWRTNRRRRAIEAQREAVELAPDSTELGEKLKVWESELR